MNTTLTEENWVIGRDAEELNKIHENEVNIAIWGRPIDRLQKAILTLLKEDFELRVSGCYETISDALTDKLKGPDCSILIEDVKQLIQVFGNVSHANSFKLLFATVSADMCRRFHYDMNDLRMLCTYAGPGTLWLKEDNVNRNALDCHGGNDTIVRDHSQVQQAQAGEVIVLKGGRYLGGQSNAIVHRSPTIEENGEKRLVLRLDTNGL